MEKIEVKDNPLKLDVYINEGKASNELLLKMPRTN